MRPNFDKLNGLLPVVIQEFSTKSVLMVGFMNPEAFQKTLETDYVTFYSRTKERLWTKGETSGNYLIVKSVQLDCDNDSLLINAEAIGNTCHMGLRSCFGLEEKSKISSPQRAPSSQSYTLENLEQIIKQRKEGFKEGSYTNELFSKGLNKIAQKVGEEATEILVAALGESKDRLKEETADFLYHLLVLLQEKGVGFNDVLKVLEKRSV